MMLIVNKVEKEKTIDSFEDIMVMLKKSAGQIVSKMFMKNKDDLYTVMYSCCRLFC